MSITPIDPKTRLTRRQTAAALTDQGFKISESTLATKASRGGGPPFERWGKKAVTYTWGTTLKWAEERLSKPLSSTSELDTAATASKTDRMAQASDASQSERGI